MFLYELSLSEFKSSSSHLNVRFRAWFEQGVPWHSGNYRVWIYSETCTWHDKNVQSLEKVVKSVQKTHQNDVSSVSIVDFEQVNVGREIISLMSSKVTHICLWMNVMRNIVIYEIYFASVKEQSPGSVLWKKVFLKISQNSQKNICVGFFNKHLYIKNIFFCRHLRRLLLSVT